MFNLFKKQYLASLLTVASLSTFLHAEECCTAPVCNRVYVGAFGGGLYSTSTTISQMGTAFFVEEQGGPLAVNAEGSTKSTSSGFGGIQMGYEGSKCPLNMGCSTFTLTPAIEGEAFWFSHTKKGHLLNSTDRLPEHDFSDSFPMRAGVYLVNAVFSLNHSCFGAFSPYIGGGVGATRLSINNATSTQTSPVEVGINHFNSNRSDSSWAFAAQAKAGLRYTFCKSFHIFGEYRYLFVDSSNYIFGSTVYPDHATTSPWNVKIRNIHYNAFVFGIQYDL